ncbi:MAG: GIY-YIG nuclease family protein [Candidatus Cloacimonetes bacterium]|nr:GIY-YIG nuclease family protein [Candidatus Cloacimonadota bacterium]
MCYTYILYSESTDRFYIGSCSDIELRLQRHNDGWSRSTKHGRPWTIVYYEEYRTKSEALKRENEIKKKKSRKYIEYLINSRRSSR